MDSDKNKTEEMTLVDADGLECHLEIYRNDDKIHFKIRENKVYPPFTFENDFTLNDFIEHHKFPDGEVIDEENIDSDFGLNKIAITDINGDGKPELIIKFSYGTQVRILCEYICGFNEKTKKITIDYIGYPDLEYFNNGCIKEYYEPGKLKFEGDYLNGERNGKGKEFNYFSELEYEGEYLSGKRHGKGKEFNSKG